MRRFLSSDEAQALVKRAIGLAAGGGSTEVELDTSWQGNLRWAHNLITTAGDISNNALEIERSIRGAKGTSRTNQIDDANLLAAIRRAERLLNLRHELPEEDLKHEFIEPYPRPTIWNDATYGLDAEARATGMLQLTQSSVGAGLQSAGYVQVAAHGVATMDEDRVWYYPYTTAQFSITVQDPATSASGWAGVDGNDWSKLDAAGLTAIALDKCVRSRNPVAIEPGYYTAILEPQAVADFINILFTPDTLDRESAEAGKPNSLQDSRYFDPNLHGTERLLGPYTRAIGLSKIGERVIDDRLTVSSDPMDPDLSFPPFKGWQVFHPVTWFKDGVLQELAYGRLYAVKELGKNTGGLASTGSYRLSGRGETPSVDEMIATTKRGVLVTRFGGVPRHPLDVAMTLTGYTRGGVWLIENGKITKPIRNFRFTESPLIALNKVEQVGVPKRVFRPKFGDDFPEGFSPVMVPALKIRDFNFSSLAESI